MRRKLFKILTLLFILCVAAAIFSGCSSIDVRLQKDGAGTAVLTIAQEEGITEESIRSQLEEVFEGVEKLSNKTDVLKIKKIKQQDGCFEVEISFRRIRYIEGIGEYNYMTFQDFLKEINKTAIISGWEQGKYKTIQNYTEDIYNFNNRSDESRAFSPETIDGIKISAEEFLDKEGVYAQNADAILFSYYIIDFEGLESVTFHFDGDIKVFGGKNIEVVDNNTIKILPLSTSVNVTHIDENGDPVAIEKNVNSFAGYVYFEPGANIAMILGLSIGGVVLAGFIIYGILSGLFKKIWNGPRMKSIRKNYSLYLMMCPAIVLLILFSYLPMSGVILAFKDFSIDDGIFGSEWAGMFGFKNFYDVITTPGTSFGMLARNTVILAVLKFIFGFLCAILLAILFSYLKDNWFKKTVQTISYFPYFISWVVVSGIAYLFLAADGGILNQLRMLFGQEAVQWYSEPQYWRGILTFTAIWKTVGYSTIVYLAAMTAIEPSLYEAARIDGGGRIAQLYHITLPGMFPVIGIQIIFSLGNLVRDDFDQIYTMTGGGNSYLIETTEVIGTVVFKAIGTVASYCTATAMSLMQSVVALAIVLSSNIIVKKIGLQGMF